MTDDKDIERRLAKLERALFTRIALSNPIGGIARDAPYEQGLQTNKITAPQGIGQFVNAWCFPPQGIVLVNGANQNIAIGNAETISITGPTAAFSLGGFAGGADGRLLFVLNRVAQTMTISNGAAGSAAANRISTLTSADVVLRANAASFATFQYHSSVLNWVLIATN